MKKFYMILVAIFCATTLFAQPKLTKDNIDEIIKAMTLEEKATLCVGGSRSAIVEGVTSGVTSIIDGAAGNTRAIPRLGIPNTVLADGPAGLRINPTRQGTNDTFYCTGFPIGTLLASSWDTDLVKEVTTAMGNEVLEYGVDVLLAPGMNIHRNPLCGRNFEYFSEDPLLSGKIGAAYVNGVQSNGVGVSVKHYALNNQETNRNEDNAKVSVRALREIYLKTFEITVRDANPWTVMSSYNKLNGNYTQQSYDLLTKALRNDFGFKGIVMTDWGNKAGTVNAVLSGNDLMEPGAQSEIDRIIAGVKDGTIPEVDLDRNVRRILEFIVKTPRFAGYKFSNKPDLKAHAEVARKAAGEAIVLLKNDNNTLPVAPGKKVALYGVGAIDFVAGGTGSGNVNKAYVVNMVDGLKNAGYVVNQNLVNFYNSYIAFNNAQNALTGAGGRNSMWGAPKLSEVAISRAAIDAQAKSEDFAIVVIGRNAGEGADRKVENDFNLSTIERQLLTDVSEAFHIAGKKVIVVLNIGGVIETASWKSMADAIVLPWSPGQEGANAVGDVLVGKVNPSGRLPMTFPLNFIDHPSSVNFPFQNTQSNSSSSFNGRGGQPQPRKDVDYTDYAEGIWVGYRYFNTVGKEVSYPFGYGLSYTTFSYSKPSVKVTADGIVASVTVTNTGKVEGKEVVEVYISAPAGGLDKPARELKSFGKTKSLNPGESQVMTFNISNYELASFNEASNKWETAAGTYNVGFGKNVNDICVSASVKVKDASFAVSDAYTTGNYVEEIKVK